MAAAARSDAIGIKILKTMKMCTSRWLNDRLQKAIGSADAGVRSKRDVDHPTQEDDDENYGVESRF